MYNIITDVYIWNMWLFPNLFLIMIYWVGYIISFPYEWFWKYIDVEFKSRSRFKKRTIRKLHGKKNFPLSVLAGKYCVYRDVCNVYAQDLAMLNRSFPVMKTSFAARIVDAWNDRRSAIPQFPPTRWPTLLLFMVIMCIVAMHTILQGYKRVLYATRNERQSKMVLQTSTANISKQNSPIFVSDSKLIIIDNLANCIIWNDKKSFVPETYRSLNSEITPIFDTAAGPGNAVGIEDLSISWKDDNSKIYHFVLSNVFHIPDSPVNILGISAFLKCIGDYKSN